MSVDNFLNIDTYSLKNTKTSTYKKEPMIFLVYILNRDNNLLMIQQICVLTTRNINNHLVIVDAEIQIVKMLKCVKDKFMYKNVFQ